ncbi:MAG: DNA methyltransferase [Candidatus Nanohaloarchaea archaeon]
MDIHKPKKLEDDTSPRSGLSKIYQLHKYWGRKPWKPINDLIEQNSEPGDLVADLFLGSGVMAVESVIQQRDFVGYDLNPMSKFITENTLQNEFSKERFEEELSRIKDELEDHFLQLYSAEKGECEKCGKRLTAVHHCIGPKREGEEKGKFYCYDCGRRSYQETRDLTEEELEKSKKSYDIEDWVPEREFPERFYKDRFSYKGVDKVTDFYTERNLYALSKLRATIKDLDLKYENLFMLAFSNTVLHASKLKGENVRPLGVNNYWIPGDYIEENVWMRFLERVDRVIDSKMKLKEKSNNLENFGEKGNYEINIQSATNIGLDDESVDYIITDPPYGEAIQYFELSFIWNSWMRSEFEKEKEVIVNPKQDKDESDFLKLLEKAIGEGSRVLKQGGKFTLCFQNKKFKIWNDVLEIFRANNLALEDVVIVESLGSTYNNNWSDFSPEHDIYLTFEKRESIEYEKNQEIEVKDVLKRVLEYNEYENPAEAYDRVASTLIWEIYYNEYNINVSDLTIKKLSEMMQELT